MEKRIKGDGPSKQLTFKELINLKEWQKIQDNFSAITQIGIRTLDGAGLSVTSPSGQPRLCTEVIRDFALKKRLCDWCLPTFLGGNAVVDKNLGFSCPLGLKVFVAPLINEVEHVIAYVVLGPVFVGAHKVKPEYNEFAKHYNLDVEELFSALSEIRLISFNGIQSLLELMQDVGNYIIKSSYQHLTMEKPMVVIDREKLNQLLKVFLDVAFQVSGADVGSVMLMNKSTQELSILTSRGIPQDIASATRVKVGEGICGTAAKERTSFLIDDNIKDNRIKRYLNRPSLKSSMVLPIKLHENVLGVVNLGALQKSPVQFNDADLAMINRLIDLVVTALH
ncbi:MAG: PocR ligand-binding domain-containing protein [Candidatus Omnitrophica bacterium]|nr:PocR ligand-binding domain-containing protein [Candidatus Omnitrophota bacterium]